MEILKLKLKSSDIIPIKIEHRNIIEILLYLNKNLIQLLYGIF